MHTEPSTVAARRWFAADLALGILVFLLFIRCSAGEFCGLDDNQYVLDNSHVLTGVNWDNFLWAWKSVEASNWHPLTWLSLQLDVTLFGPDPWGFHLTNVILHSLAAVFLSVALRSLTGSAALSWLTALLFAIHPLRVESVAWISERKDVLSVLFGTLALWAYARYAKSPSFWRWSVVAGTFLLSLLAKPMLVTLPCIFWLLDYWPLGRFEREPLRRLILEKLPLLAASCASVVVTVLAQVQGRAVVSSDRLPWNLRLANSLLSVATYLWQTVWPMNLAVFYPHPHVTLLDPRIWVIGGVLLAVTVLLIRERTRMPYLLVGWLWFLGSLSPVLGLVAQQGIQGHADRFTYWPHIGLFLGALWGIERLCNRFHVPVAARCMLILCIAVPWSVLSYRQIGIWKSVPDLWSHTMKVTENNAFAMNVMASWHHKQGRVAEAISLNLRALRADPEFGPPRFYLGKFYLHAGEFEKSARILTEASVKFPRDSGVWFNLGCAEAQLGHRVRARECFEQTIQLKPDEGNAYYHLGLLLFDSANMQRSAQLLEEAIRLNPGSSQFQAGLGKVRCWEGKDAEAIEHFEKALKIDGSDVGSAEILGQLLERQGRFEEAADVLQRTISNSSSERVAMLQALCGLVLNAQGKSGEATQMYASAKQRNPDWKREVAEQGWKLASAEKVANRRPAWARQSARMLIEAHPDQPEGYDLLAAVLAAQGHFDDAVKEADRAMALAPEGVPLRKSIKARQDHYRKKQAWVGPP